MHLRQKLQLHHVIVLMAIKDSIRVIDGHAGQAGQLAHFKPHLELCISHQVCDSPVCQQVCQNLEANWEVCKFFDICIKEVVTVAETDAGKSIMAT